MKRHTWKFLVLAGAAIGFVACKDTLTPSLISDAQLASNEASSAGDALASEVRLLDSNAVSAGLPSSQPSSVSASAMAGDSFVVVRSRTCFDGTNAVIACTNIASVRKVVTHFSVNGSAAASSSPATCIAWQTIL